MRLLATEEAAARLGMPASSLRVLNHRRPELALQAPRELWPDQRSAMWSAAAIEAYLAGDDDIAGGHETVLFKQHYWNLAETLAPFGALAITEAIEPGATALRWDHHTGAARISASPGDLAQTIKAHAEQTAHRTWFTADSTAGDRPLFGWSQRPPTDDDLHARATILPTLNRVELALIDGIGMPGDPIVPVLASLPARQHGKVIVKRLRDAAAHISTLSEDQIVDVLTTGTVIVPAGDLGMSTPPIDQLTGWLAIWGMAFYPIRWTPTGRPDNAGTAIDPATGIQHIAIPLNLVDCDFRATMDITCSRLLQQAAAGTARTRPTLQPAWIAHKLWPDVAIIRWPTEIRRVGPSSRRTATAEGELLPFDWPIAQ